MNHGNTMDLHDTAVVRILPKPPLIVGSLSARDRDVVSAWIALNHDTLLGQRVPLSGALQSLMVGQPVGVAILRQVGWIALAAWGDA
jgi:hypothetical protein